MPSFSQTLESQLLINARKLKHEALSKLLQTVCWFYIHLMCFLLHNKLLFMPSITKKLAIISLTS